MEKSGKGRVVLALHQTQEWATRALPETQIFG
jgi:hypothetical protein